MHCLVQAREPVQFGEHGLDTLGTGLKHDHKILRRSARCRVAPLVLSGLVAYCSTEYEVSRTHPSVIANPVLIYGDRATDRVQLYCPVRQGGVLVGREAIAVGHLYSGVVRNVGVVIRVKWRVLHG